MSPAAQVFEAILNEMGELVTWLGSWNLFGVPFIFYFIGVTIMYILFDRIF